MNDFKRYYAAVNYIEGLSNLPTDNEYIASVNKRNSGVYIARMRYFLNLIGNPDKGLKYIHITGTAGKGTVTNMVHEMIRSSGKRVGSFTSPFVTTSIEKIKFNDRYISPNEFADIVDYLKPFIDQAYISGPYGRPSYFEIFLAIAFVYFKKKQCDWVVLEVGLGGRFDATNVIEEPIVTAITTIDYDHTQVLGKTLKEIAYDKAGIIKSGSTFFTAEQRPALIEIFRNVCAANKVWLNQIIHKEDYQEYNLALASRIAEHIGISNEHIEKGSKKSSLQCRFEIVQRKPIIVLDGAHNRSKIKSTVLNLKKMKFSKLHLIIGMADSKDDMSILKEIIPHANVIYFTRFQIKDRKCAHPKKLEQRAKQFLSVGSKSIVNLDPQYSLSSALKHSRKGDVVLVAGSFFLAGEIRKKWCSEEKILAKRTHAI